MRRKTALVGYVSLLLTLALASCTSSSGDPTEEGMTGNSTTTSAGESQGGDDGASSQSQASSTTAPGPLGELVIRPDVNEGDSGNNSWIGTALMTDSGIQLAWDLADVSVAVDGDVTYRIYRIPTDQLAAEGWASPEEAVLTGEQLLYDIQDEVTNFTDNDVETGRFYTYYLVGYLVDGASEITVVTRRWTTGLAVTDTEPPTAIAGLEADVTDEGVLLSWQPSTDNVEFAAYSVSLVGSEGQLTYLGGGADPSLTSFLDNQPAESGLTVEYVVEAVDYHNNRSEPASITITVP